MDYEVRGGLMALVTTLPPPTAYAAYTGCVFSWFGIWLVGGAATHHTTYRP